ncbi:hypothetical protein [Streptomyces sp. CRN 30]|nr:hypothetical protein [Streptomyces sp. CRN 30]
MRPGLVLGYAATPPGAIAQGVAALGEALRDLARHVRKGRWGGPPP